MLNALPLKRDRAVFQLDLPYVRAVDALAALEHAVSPRTYDLAERFTPLVSLTQFKPAFSGNRFRFRCPVGRPQPLAFDVDGEVSASPSGGTTLRFSIHLAYPWLHHLSGALMLVWFGALAWIVPHGVGLIPLAVMAVFVRYSLPAYVLSCRQDLEIRLRELRPFLLSRIPP
jgi:hypothetical protein